MYRQCLYTLVYANFNSDFYNYFQHGLDFLISSTSHIVQKIVLHTNIVRRPTVTFFSRSFMCPARNAPVSTLQEMQLGD